MREAIVTLQLLLIPALCLAQQPPKAMPKPPPAAREARMAEKAKAKGMEHAEEGKAKPMEAHVHKAEGKPEAMGKKGEAMPAQAQGAEHGGMRHGKAAAEMARGLVHARADLARARVEARRGERERLREHMSKGGHAMPMAALREEMRRHARRIARLARVREMAETHKDADSLPRVDKLIDRENERHERWMGKHGSAPAQEGATP